MVTLKQYDSYSTEGFSIEYDYGRSVKVKVTESVDNNPVEHTVCVNVDELRSALDVIVARMGRQ
jgi:hypothetical protein